MSVKVYNNFTQEKIFKDVNLNVLCNRVFHFLTEEFGATIMGEFAVTGTFAKILNGDVSASSALKVIPFITSNLPLYNFSAEQLPKTLDATAIKYKDRIQLKVNGVFLEIWLTTTLNKVESHTINTQVTADIPANIN